MKNKNKFGFGGYVDPISEYLNIKRQRASNIPNQIESPDQAIADNNIRLSRAQQKAMSNPLTQGLDIFGNIAMQVGSSMMSKGISAGEGENGKGIAGFLNKNQNFINTLLGGLNAGASFATGGVAGNKKINAEGGEVVETPDGLSQELVGPSHAEGGIDMTVPSGTEIYSDKLLGVDGKTMAERKKAREREIKSLMKLIKKNPLEKTLKKTLEKIKQNNDFLDKQDLSQMQFVKDLVDHTNKFALGGYVNEKSPMPIFNNKYKDLLGLFSKGLPTDVGTTYYPDRMVENMLKDKNAQDLQSLNNTQSEVYAPASTDPEGKYGNATSAKTGDAKNFSLDDYLGGTTFGDMLGMGANLFGPMAQMNNTLENRSATPVEQNWFKDYGKQALSKIQDQYGLLDDIRDNALSSLEKDKAGSISRNNASARSINTQRALNLATDAAINNNKSDLYSKFAQSMLGVKSQEAAQMDKNDQMKMSGEDKRAERELQNTDNFFSQMAQNISDKYRGIGETGKAFNQTKQRETTNEILKGIYPNFEIDPYTGKLIAKKTEAIETEKGKEADVKREGTSKETSLFTKDGKPTAKFIKDYEENPEKYNYKNSKGERATPTEIADVLYRQSKNKFVQDLEEFDTTYKTKSINGRKFTSNEEYKLALDAGRTDIRDWNTFKGNPTVGKYKGKQLSSEVVNKIENILQEHNLNVDTSDTKSVKALQKILGVKQTGNFGDETLKALLGK